MPGGEGSNVPLSLHDFKSSFDKKFRTSGDIMDECLPPIDNCDGDDSSTTIVEGDGVRRRKVIRAAKETLDKGKNLFTFTRNKLLHIFSFFFLLFTLKLETTLKFIVVKLIK